MGQENHIFCSEIGLGFQGVHHTPTPKFLGSTYLSPCKYLIAPGGNVEGVSVLLTAAVILLTLP